jgi:hypothetical protein
MRDINVIPRLFSFYFDEKINYPLLEEVYTNEDIDLGYG